ncbi:MAG: hypothetical protein HZA83_01535 [Thaumarchaeota archaeon]|nr:hypothetical protein [Nitrososphaerota archaeon]
MLNVLMRARVPLYMHRKSNHLYTVWQHLILLASRQYEGKSYRRFIEWFHEAYSLRIFLQLDRLPYYTTFQKFAARMNGTLLYRIVSSPFPCTQHVDQSSRTFRIICNHNEWMKT